MNLREWALPVYTILMQLSVGSLAVLWTIRAVFLPKYGEDEMERMMRNPVAIILITILAAMIGSFFHLSRPYFSFLAILNFDRSWLSREVFFTILMFGSVTLLWYLQANVAHHTRLKTLLGWAGVVFGLSATYSMTHCYLIPTQASWNTLFTVTSFYSSILMSGVSASISMIMLDLQYSQIRNPGNIENRTEIIRRSFPVLALVVSIVFVSILAQYGFLFRTLNAGDPTAQASLQLYQGLYRPLLIFRLAAGLVGVIWLWIAVVRILRGKLQMENYGFNAYAAFLWIMIGEVLGRFLFYATHVRLGL